MIRAMQLVMLVERSEAIDIELVSEDDDGKSVRRRVNSSPAGDGALLRQRMEAMAAWWWRYTKCKNFGEKDRSGGLTWGGVGWRRVLGKGED